MSHGYNLMTHHYSGMVGTERVNAYRVAGAVEAGLYFDDRGELAIGKRADIVLLDEELNVQKVILKGVAV